MELANAAFWTMHFAQCNLTECGWHENTFLYLPENFWHYQRQFFSRSDTEKR